MLIQELNDQIVERLESLFDYKIKNPLTLRNVYIKKSQELGSDLHSWELEILWFEMIIEQFKLVEPVVCEELSELIRERQVELILQNQWVA